MLTHYDLEQMAIERQEAADNLAKLNAPVAPKPILADDEVFIVMDAGNDYHRDFSGVYKSLESASRDLDGVLWTAHTVPVSPTFGQPPTGETYTYWRGTDRDLSFLVYEAHIRKVV